MTPSPVRVSLHVWRVPARRLPAVLHRMARDRGRLRRRPDVEFAKLLGTARGFGPARPDLTRWAALVVWRGADPVAASEVGPAWGRLATGHCRLDLRPLASRGTWAGRSPFPIGPRAEPADGPVLALTRARLRPGRAVAFWRAIAAPAAALPGATGLVSAFGIGEVPLGWPGTVSLWRDARDLVEFAYRQPAHQNVIARTPERRWYVEELFARFAVVAVHGDLEVIGAAGGGAGTDKDGPVSR